MAKCSFVTKSINETGLYISDLDRDKRYADRYNPQGFFRLILYPAEGQVLYHKVDGGYFLFGDALIIKGIPRKINEKVKKIQKRYDEIKPAFAYIESPELLELYKMESGKNTDCDVMKDMDDATTKGD